jgi:hypothetical protein
MRFARGDMREPPRFTQKRPRSFVSALRSIAVVEPAKNQLLRNFRRRSIFDFATLSRVERTSLSRGPTSESDPIRTSEAKNVTPRNESDSEPSRQGRFPFTQ